MKKIADFCALATLTLSLCLAGAAYAGDPEPPPECNDGGRNERFYDLGYFKGVSLVNQAWASLGDEPCDHDALTGFVDIVVDAFAAGEPAAGSPLIVYCHYAGSYEGALEQADELVNDCEEECYVNGRMIGEMGATFYCQLSIAFGGLGHDEWLVEADLSPCGEIFVPACEERFGEVTYNYPSAADPQCREYTEEPYSDPPDGVYEEARHNQCIYELDP